MVSLREVRGSRKTTTTIKPKSAPTPPLRRSRNAAQTVRPRSAPSRISLNKESILRMTRTEARSTLRATTPVTFYRMGQRGLILFALLLIMATQPTQAFINHAVAVGGHVPPGAPVKAKRWYESFHAQETSAATQVARSASATAVAVATGSGTATTALVLSQLSSSAWGKYIMTMVVISYLIKMYVDYGKAYMNRQTAKNQMVLIKEQMVHQQRMLEMILEQRGGNIAPRRRGGKSARRLISANRVALPALMAA